MNASGLLGLLSRTRLAAFEQRAADAARATDLGDKTPLARASALAHEQFQQVRDHLTGLGHDPEAAMEPFADAVDGYHRHARANDAIEALVKVYIGDAMIDDLLREAAQDSDTRAVIDRVLAKDDALIADRIRSALDDQVTAARLGMWARRLAGEVHSLAHHVDDLLPSDTEAKTFVELTARQNARMREVGLQL